MSIITDAILITIWDKEAAEEMNKEIERRDSARNQRFNLLDNSHSGGTKFPSFDVYQACFNHIRDKDIIEPFYSADWRNPGLAILILDSELCGHSVHCASKGILIGNKYDK